MPNEELALTEVEEAEAVEIPQDEATKMVPAKTGDILGLMEIAVREGGESVKALERLIDLQERVMARDARKEFFDALAAFQDDVPEINKARTAKITMKSGGSYSYTFAPFEEIARTIRPVLKAHGFSYNHTTEGAEGGILSVVCVLRHEGGHEERSVFPVPTQTDAAMSGAQKMGAALHYGKRQSLTAVLGLTTADQDTDGADPTQYINESQLADLRAKLEEVGATEARICKTYGLAHLEALPSHLLPPVIDALEEKARKAGA